MKYDCAKKIAISCAAIAGMSVASTGFAQKVVDVTPEEAKKASADQAPVTAKNYGSLFATTPAIGAGSGGSVGGSLNVGTCECFWDNGGFDGIDGQASVLGGTIVDGGARAADDFYLPNGKFYRLDSVSGLLLTDDDTPNAQLEIYTDCNGKPDRLITTIPMAGMADTGIDAYGLDLIEFGFDASACWLEGGQFYWVSVIGLGDTGMETYFFATTGSGVVQGVEGHFLLPKQGFTSWTSLKETNIGKSDLAFSVCVTDCDILWDNGEFDPTEDYKVEVNQALPNYRSADNFALAPCADWNIDMVQLCVLTNCDITTLQMEIYETDPVTCMPYVDPLYTFDSPKMVDLGVSVSTVETVPMTVDAYLLQYQNLETELPGGATYWIAARAQGTASFRDRTFFCEAFDCNKDSNCQIKISPAKFFKPSVGDWEDFGSFIGDGDDRELSFLVCGSRKSMDDVQPDPGTAVADTTVNKSKKNNIADVDGNGIVNDADFTAFINAFFGNGRSTPEVAAPTKTVSR